MLFPGGVERQSVAVVDTCTDDAAGGSVDHVQCQWATDVPQVTEDRGVILISPSDVVDMVVEFDSAHQESFDDQLRKQGAGGPPPPSPPPTRKK